MRTPDPCEFVGVGLIPAEPVDARPLGLWVLATAIEELAVRNYAIGRSVMWHLLSLGHAYFFTFVCREARGVYPPNGG